MIAVLGGTFDPIHTGHLSIAKQANNLLNPDKLLFMPCKKPVHKKNAKTDCIHRINMLKLATASIANSEIDLREIERNSPSYAVDSLQCLRLQYLNQPLFFIIGMDSLNTLHTWYKWQVCLEHANFLVFKRPKEIFNPDNFIMAVVGYKDSTESFHNNFDNIEYFNEEMELLQEKIARKHGYTVVRHVHQLFVKPIK